MVSRANTSKRELKIPATVGKGQDREIDTFSNQLGLMKFLLWQWLKKIQNINGDFPEYE